MSHDSRPDTYAHIAAVRGLLLGVVGDLTRRAHQHDVSKLHEPELSTFDRVTPKLKGTTYGSPEYEGYLNEMGEALGHHYRNNDHHPEHHLDDVNGMDLLQLTEMLCDWMAATRRHDDGDIRASIEKNAKRFGYGEEIKRLLHNTVDQLEALDLGP